MPDVSIAISVKDNFSDAITTMRNANQSFNKDLTGTMEKLDKLNETKYQLKVDTDKARDALKAAEKQYNATGDAADKMARDMAAADYDKAKRNLNLVSKNARQAEKDIVNMTGAVEKADNRAGRVSAIKESGNSGLLSRLAAAGFTKMAGDTLSNVAQTYITSAFSNETGNAVSSVLGGITNGAAMGTAVAPGVGTAVGAAAGAASGAIEAATKTFSDKDNYFKSTVQDQYNTIKNMEQSNLESGSEIASQREQDLIAFSTILGGKSRANTFLNSIRKFGNETPFEYDQLTRISRTLLAYGYKQNEIIPLLTKVGDTGSALGMNMTDINMVATVLGRMKSTGKATLEYLNPLLERGIDVWGYLSKATGKSKTQVQEMVSKGLLPGATAAKDIADAMGKANKGSMKLQSETYSGLKSTLEDVKDDLKAALGEGYNEEAKKGIQDQIQTMSGKAGESLKAAYKMKGKFQADLQNKQYQLEADAYTSVTTGKITGKFSKDHQKELQQLAKDYKDAMSKATKGNQSAQNQAEIDTVKASIIAGNEYKATEGYQLEQQGNLDLIDSIQTDDALNGAYWETGYRFGEKYSSGFIKAVQTGLAAWLHPGASKGSGTQKEKTKTAIAPSDNSIASSFYTGNKWGGSFNSQATGINRVPYNNYATLLHEDERVLTGAEARSQKSGGGIKIEINGPVTVRKESDIDELASKFYRKLKMADAITP